MCFQGMEVMEQRINPQLSPRYRLNSLSLQQPIHWSDYFSFTWFLCHSNTLSEFERGAGSTREQQGSTPVSTPASKGPCTNSSAPPCSLAPTDTHTHIHKHNIFKNLFEFCILLLKNSMHVSILKIVFFSKTSKRPVRLRKMSQYLFCFHRPSQRRVVAHVPYFIKYNYVLYMTWLSQQPGVTW
jgi:hypothetical protein